MHKRPVMLAALCALFLFVTALPETASASPFWKGAGGSDSKTDCTKQSGTNKEKSKECDSISNDRMSTKMKADKPAAAKTSDSSSAPSKGDLKSMGMSKTAEKSEKKDSKNEADALSKDRMSTRGLDPPKDAAKDQTAKPDSTANPK